MKFPIMNKRTRQSVSVPDLSGGINLRDSLTTVQDNQLTDAVNMWFKDGALRTRPGIGKTSFSSGKLYESLGVRKHDIRIGDGEVVSLLGVEKDKVEAGNEQTYTMKIYFFLIGTYAMVNKPLASITIVERTKNIEDVSEAINYIVFKKDKWLYCFANYKIYALDSEYPEGPWEKDVKPHVPIYLTNGLGGAKTESDFNTSECKGDILNGLNMISPYYKAIYSTVNTSLLDSDYDTHLMAYKLPIFCEDVVRKKITVEIEYKSGEKATHMVEFTEDTLALAQEEEPNRLDGLRMFATGKHIIFYQGTGQTVATVSRSGYLLNNMTVTAPVEITEENLNKVFGMTECTWFGGASAGINGGTRLFLGGNTTDGEKNLVLWSGLNEPLYFSENCYAYVGDSQQSVTAFGKQSDMLVIFKEHETYFTQYTRNDSITAESLINQSVVDYAASSVYFPLTLIHSHIGCDLPESIQLCRNRLVWTCSDGKVYSLITNNQYSERNIYEVGEMIRRKLAQSVVSRDVSSADWQGYYVLMHGGEMYLMDYNSSGFQYAYSYQKNEDANLRIPWYYWKLDTLREEYLNNALLNIDGTLMVVSAYTGGYTEDGGVAVYLFNEKSDDNGKPIHSSLTTKLFDFGLSGYRKNVDAVQLMLGNNGGAPITVGFVTDCGTEYDEISVDGEETDSYSAGYIGAITLSPCIRSVLRLGVKLSCDGPLTVDSMSLKYRILGGAR